MTSWKLYAFSFWCEMSHLFKIISFIEECVTAKGDVYRDNKELFQFEHFFRSVNIQTKLVT